MNHRLAYMAAAVQKGACSLANPLRTLSAILTVIAEGLL
jgi:hypothetical protein